MVLCVLVLLGLLVLRRMHPLMLLWCALPVLGWPLIMLILGALQALLLRCTVLLARQVVPWVPFCRHLWRLLLFLHPVLPFLLHACPVMACQVVPWVPLHVRMRHLMPFLHALLPLLHPLLYTCHMLLSRQQLPCVSSRMQDTRPSTALLEDGWAAVDIGAAGAMSEQAKKELWVCWHCMLLVPLTGDAGVPAVLPMLLGLVLQGSGQCSGVFEAAAAEAHVLG